MRCKYASCVGKFYDTDSASVVQSAVSAIKVHIDLSSARNETLIYGCNCGYLDAFSIDNAIYAASSVDNIEYWPCIRPFRTIVAKDSAMPFLKSYFDNVIIIHHCEFDSENLEAIHESCRILKSNGKLCVVLFNKLAKYKIHSRVQTIKSLNVCMRDVANKICDEDLSIEYVYPINKLEEFNLQNRFSKLCCGSVFKVLPILSDVIVIIARKDTYSVERVNVLETTAEIV